jgi:predicted TIM-barrel fold metal-dependent hydrolase
MSDLVFDQIDCDSHIQEAGGTWETYLDPEYWARRPAVIENTHVSGRPKRNRTWYIDGQLVPRNQGPGGVVMSTPTDMTFAVEKPVRPEVQACSDPLGRARAAHEAGLRRTVMYSTLFLQAFTEDIDYEAALMRAWNRWMSEMCSQDRDTLAFAAPVPLRDPALAVEAVHGAKEMGASAVMVLPTAGEILLHDPRLDRFWAACAAADMPVAVHIGWPQPSVTNSCTTPSTVFLGAFDTSMWWAYTSILTGGVLDRHPQVRVAFLENDARFFELFLARAMHWFPTSAASPWPTKVSPIDALRNNQVYFSFEGDFSTLPRFVDLVGADRVMAALDFPHTHYGTASLSVALDLVRDHEGLDHGQKQWLLRDAARAFYGYTDFADLPALPVEVGASA